VSSAVAVWCLLTASLACVAFGQQAASEAQLPTTTLQVKVREVLLDVVVTDRNGKPVLDLKKKDFSIVEDKVTQDIRSFSPPAEHVPPPESPEIRSARDLVKAGNIPINLIILDELNTPFEDMSYGRFSAEKYLKAQPARLPSPTTVLSLSDSGFKLLHDYTEDRDELVQAVHKHMPALPFTLMKGGGTGPDAGDQFARCLGAMLQIAQAVQGYGGRKTIVWVGKGFPSLDSDNVNEDKAKELLQAVRMVTSSMLTSRSVLNIIDPTPLSVSSLDFSNTDYVTPDMLNQALAANGQPLFSDDINFAQFAPATGGLTFYARNDLDRAIATSIRDGADYYTMSYSPTNKSDDSTVIRNIQVRVSDPSLKVWTRSGYYLEHQPEPSEPMQPPPVKQLAFDLMNAAVSTVAYTALQVSAEQTEDGYKVNVQPIGLAYREVKRGTLQAEVTLMYACFNAKSKVLAHDAREFSAVVRDQPWVMNFDVPVAAPPNTDRIRFVVRDAVSGKLGTVDVVLTPGRN
jgi:VWFA-related protein